MWARAAVGCFLIAAIIDFPFPHGPSARQREFGNFVCSIGFVLLALALASL